MTETEKIGQEQFQSFVFSDNLSWQELIYDLINSEQLDPWDINIATLAEKYIEKVQLLEEANYNMSSKVLIVCSLLLRIKSEILLNKYLKDLDDILFKRKPEVQETLKLEEFDEETIPDLIPRTPLPRFKKISLQELMAALSKAVETESRRTERKVVEKEMYERTQLYMPKKSINLQERIKNVHERVKLIFQTQEKIPFSEFSGNERAEKINTFIPLLHLDTQSKVWLEQEYHLREIYIQKQRTNFANESENEIITNSISSEFEDQMEKIEGFDEVEEPISKEIKSDEEI